MRYISLSLISQTSAGADNYIIQVGNCFNLSTIPWPTYDPLNYAIIQTEI